MSLLEVILLHLYFAFAVDGDNVGLIFQKSLDNCRGELNTSIPIELNIPASQVTTVQGRGGQTMTKVQVTLQVLLQCTCNCGNRK